MKTHIATGEEFGTITAELVDGSKPLVLVGLGAVQLITTSEDDADQLIRAGELAKQLHRQARAHGDAAYVSPYGASADEVARDAEPWSQAGTEPEVAEAEEARCASCGHKIVKRTDGHGWVHANGLFAGLCPEGSPHPQPASPLAPPAPYTTGGLAGVPAEDDAR